MDYNYEEMARNGHNAFSRNDFETCLSMVADDVMVISHGLGVTFNGKEGFAAFLSGHKAAFPDMVLNHTNILSKGNCVAVEFTADGTNTGILHTPMGDIPPSGRPVSLAISEFWVFEGDKIKTIHNYSNSADLMRQIGAM